MKSVIFAMLVVLLTGCASSPGYRHTKDDWSVPENVLPDIIKQFDGACPTNVIVQHESVPVGAFDPRTSTIYIGREEKMRVFSVAHETVHLCLSRLSNGNSTSTTNRWWDEGYARYYDRRMALGVEKARKLVFQKARQLDIDGFINIEKARDWVDLVGVQGQGGKLGPISYYIGSSFYLFIEDTYGEKAFFDLVHEIGYSMTFNSALKSVFNKDQDAIQAEWSAYITEKTKNIKIKTKTAKK